MASRPKRQLPGRPRHRPRRAVVDAVLAAVAANLAIYAGWTQSTTLRVLAALAFLLVTGAGVVAHVGLRPRMQASLPAKGDFPLFCGRGRGLGELPAPHTQRPSPPPPCPPP